MVVLRGESKEKKKEKSSIFSIILQTKKLKKLEFKDDAIVQRREYKTAGV